MDFIDLSAVNTSAWEKYKRDVEPLSEMREPLDRARHLSVKTFEICRTLMGLISHRIDFLPSLNSLEQGDKDLFMQILTLNMTMQNIVILGRAQNYPMQALVMAQLYPMIQVDPRQYIHSIQYERQTGMQQGYSWHDSDVIKINSKFLTPIEEALNGRMHPKLAETFETRWPQDLAHIQTRAEIEQAFGNNGLRQWEEMQRHFPRQRRQRPTIMPA